MNIPAQPDLRRGRRSRTDSMSLPPRGCKKPQTTVLCFHTTPPANPETLEWRRAPALRRRRPRLRWGPAAGGTRGSGGVHVVDASWSGAGRWPPARATCRAAARAARLPAGCDAAPARAAGSGFFTSTTGASGTDGTAPRRSRLSLRFFASQSSTPRSAPRCAWAARRREARAAAPIASGRARGRRRGTSCARSAGRPCRVVVAADAADGRRPLRDDQNESDALNSGPSSADVASSAAAPVGHAARAPASWSVRAERTRVRAAIAAAPPPLARPARRERAARASRRRRPPATTRRQRRALRRPRHRLREARAEPTVACCSRGFRPPARRGCRPPPPPGRRGRRAAGHALEPHLRVEPRRLPGDAAPALGADDAARRGRRRPAAAMAPPAARRAPSTAPADDLDDERGSGGTRRRRAGRTRRRGRSPRRARRTPRRRDALPSSHLRDLRGPACTRRGCTSWRSSARGTATAGRVARAAVAAQRVAAVRGGVVSNTPENGRPSAASRAARPRRPRRPRARRRELQARALAPRRARHAASASAAARARPAPRDVGESIERCRRPRPLVDLGRRRAAAAAGAPSSSPPPPPFLPPPRRPRRRRVRPARAAAALDGLGRRVARVRLSARPPRAPPRRRASHVGARDARQRPPNATAASSSAPARSAASFCRCAAAPVLRRPITA